MATYKDFRRLFYEKQELRRAYYLYGSERVLVEEIVDAVRERTDPHDLDYLTLSAARTKPRDLWAMLNQYPVHPERLRLLIVRDAEAISDWEPFVAWANSRMLPTHVVFVSAETKVDTTVPYLKRMAVVGRVFRCSRLAPPDAVAYVMRLGKIEYGVARRLLERVGWDLESATNVMLKLRLFDVSASDRMVEALTEPSPVQSFTDELVAMHKASALQALRQMSPEEYGAAIGLLNVRLEQLGRVNLGLRRGLGTIAMVRELKLKKFVVDMLERSAKFYDRRRLVSCVQALALVDSRIQRGERVGVMELLVAIW